MSNVRLHETRFPMPRSNASSPNRHILVERAFGPALGLCFLLIVASAVYFGDHRPSELERRMHSEILALYESAGVIAAPTGCSFRDKRSAYYRCPLQAAQAAALEQHLQSSGWSLHERAGASTTYNLALRSLRIENPLTVIGPAEVVLIYHPR